MLLGNKTAKDEVQTKQKEEASMRASRMRPLFWCAPIAAALVAALLVGGSAFAGSTKTNAQPLAGKKIGLSLCCEAPIFTSWELGITSALKWSNQGEKLTIVNANGDNTTQLSQVGSLIGQKTAGIMAVTQSGVGFGPLVTKAHQAKLTYTNYASNPAPGADFNIIYPHYALAYLECHAAALWLKKTWKGVGDAGITSIPTDPGFVLRDKGCVAGLKSLYPKMNIFTAVDQTGGTPQGGATVAGNLLAAHPGIRIIFGVNDAVAQGVITGAAAAGRTTPNSLFVGDNDCALDCFTDIEKGTTMSEVVSPNFTGNCAVWALITERAMEGLPVPHTGTVNGVLVNSSNVKQVIAAQAHPFSSAANIKTTLASVNLYAKGVPPYSNTNTPKGPGLKNYWGVNPKPPTASQP
jgi:ABC-type sugar transport system substrate-binding protein